MSINIVYKKNTNRKSKLLNITLKFLENKTIGENLNLYLKVSSDTRN